MQAFADGGLKCLAAALASLIVEKLVVTVTPDLELHEHVPAFYTMDQWHALESYLRDNINDHGLLLLVRLLDAEHDWLLYRTLTSIWNVAYSDRDVTSVGLRLIHCNASKPLIRLLKHPNAIIIYSAIGLIVTALHGLGEAYSMSFIREGICAPLKQLITDSGPVHRDATERDLLVTKAINVLGWLACGDRVCQSALIEAGMLELGVPLLSSRGRGAVENVRSAWMLMNWLIYVDDGKQRFLRLGGLKLLLDALHQPSPPISVLFATRKLAMHGPSQRVLLEAGVVPLLVQWASTLLSIHERTRYAIMLALSFLVLNHPDASHSAHECIASAVDQLALDQDLNVMYTTMFDQRQLMENASITAQLFGLWWTLHLLVAEAAGHYKRMNYARMVLDEGLLPRVLGLMRSPHVRVADLAVLVVEALAKVSSTVRLQLIKQGALRHLLRVSRGSAGTHAIALLIASAPELDDDTLEQVPSLRVLCEHFALRAVDEDNVTVLVDVAYALHLPRLQARCLVCMVRMPTVPLLSDEIREDLLWVRQSLGLLVSTTS